MTSIPAPTDPTPSVLWITGAGSGVGRATAVAASVSGRVIVLSGRRRDALDETAALMRDAGGDADVVTLDTGDAAAVAEAHAGIRSRHGRVDGLVLAAGLNTPTRYWHDQSLAEFDAIVRTNLTGVAAMIDAVLPDLRDAGGGSVVLLSSYSGWRFSPDAGVAYSASKTALTSLAETLNAQENRHGIRACNLCPGDIDTDFLAQRPSVPDAEARTQMLSPADVARAVMFVLDSPAHVCMNELVISPVKRG